MRNHRRIICWAGVLLLALYGPRAVQWIEWWSQECRVDRELAQLEVERTQLAHEQQRLLDDEAYVEGLMRRTFKVAKPGEVVVPIPTVGDTRKAFRRVTAP